MLKGEMFLVVFLAFSPEGDLTATHTFMFESPQNTSLDCDELAGITVRSREEFNKFNSWVCLPSFLLNRRED
jgi:hypothetical protein